MNIFGKGENIAFNEWSYRCHFNTSIAFQISLGFSEGEFLSGPKPKRCWWSAWLSIKIMYASIGTNAEAYAVCPNHSRFRKFMSLLAGFRHVGISRELMQNLFRSPSGLIQRLISFAGYVKGTERYYQGVRPTTCNKDNNRKCCLDRKASFNAH